VISLLETEDEALHGNIAMYLQKKMLLPETGRQVDREDKDSFRNAP
jgi:hypothetical protein